MKKLFVFIIITLFILPVFSQDTKKPEEKGDEVKQVIQKVYAEVALEDFENTQYTQANLKFTKTNEQEGSIQVRDQYAAEFNNSKKYLGIKVYGRQGDTYKIIPAKPLEIDKYCKSISIWVYGKNFSGQLVMILQDASGRNHTISFGKLNFLGWKKLTVNLSRRVKQQDSYLEQEKKLTILHLQYRPGNKSLHPEWQYFYIDDITATVRDKYKDRQSDDW
ncbi:MAG TPA: flagellar filament outer layer protein FlaA [Spirochaetota bacterium]|nr:flagellar filament outer layer protein FlaA [Spirochaetota bacterium]HPJ34072.1 flagellar filament outer layer protein FlaA [Spirochaetota bacterium]